MTDDSKLGPIDVTMGSHNTVGHIGHVMFFHEPPPSPNSMWQDSQVVGEIGSAPSQDGNRVVFGKLFVTPSFDQSKPFTVQGTIFLVEVSQATTFGSNGGRPAETTLWEATCAILGQSAA